MKGSITLFMTMTLMMVASLLFSLLETVHCMGLSQQTQLLSGQSMETALSDYNPLLWEDYGILALDLSYGAGTGDHSVAEAKIRQRLEENLDNHFYAMELAGCAISRADLLTDDDGAGLIKLAVEAEKATLTEKAIETLTTQAEGMADADTVDLDTLLTESQTAIETARQSEDSGDGNGETASLSLEENPIDQVVEWKNRAFLSQLLDPSQLSQSALEEASPLSKRTVTEGNTQETLTITAADKVIFGQYLLDHMSCYRKNRGHPMSYEVEYIIAGKTSDSANLENIAKRILAMREAANLVSLSADSAKMSQASMMAAGIAAAMSQPELEPMIKAALLAAWAYTESVLDVRALLAGDKIALVKTKDQWTSDLSAINGCFDVNVRARNCSNGISYQAYLRTFLLLEKQRNLAYRTLDLMEHSLHQKEDYVNVKMEYFAYDLTCDYTFEASPIFFTFVSLADAPFGTYRWERTAELSYL